jgi:hypothetical protein
MRKSFLAISVVLLFVISCKKEPVKIDPPIPPVEVPVDTTRSQILSFELDSANNSSQLLFSDTFDITGYQINGTLPLSVKTKTLIPTFTTTDSATVTVNGVTQESGITAVDFTVPVMYEITGKNGIKSTYTVNTSLFTGIPVVYLDTKNAAPIVSKDDYLEGHLKIDGNGKFTDGIYDGDLKVKGRGNTTWFNPKKPYKLKLSAKSKILGMPSSKDWVLLANYSDKSLLRNAVAFELSNRLDMTYTPRSQFVELVLNGKYAGNYQLTEQIEIDKNRVNVTEMEASDNAGDALTGGYLLEVDYRYDDVYYFTSGKGVPVVIKEPEDITPDQLNYIKDYIASTETALYGSSFGDTAVGYAKYLNTSTFVDYYLVNEIMKNHDAAFQTSVYLYKDRLGKISIGPVWDFDIAAGNINYDDAEKTNSWRIRNYYWYQRLFQDAGFRNKVKDRWNELKSTKIDGIIDFIDTQHQYLDKSQQENFKTWEILNIYVWPNAVVPGSYQGEIDYLKTWLKDRISWMDSQINSGSY